MTTRSPFAQLARLACAAALALAGSAHAQSTNLNLWTIAGDARVVANNEVVMTTAAVDSGETTYSGHSALQYFELEPALSLAGGVLPADTFEGSGIQQSFTAAAGTRLSFGWTLTAREGLASYGDRAFVVVGGTTLLPLDTVHATQSSGTFSYTFPTSGNQSLAIAVMDVNDYVGVTMLTLYNFSVTAVPEPQSLALMAAGLALVAGLARRRQAAANRQGPTA